MGLDSPLADAEDMSDFWFWHVDDVAQHDDLLLPSRERPHGADYVVPLDDVRRSVPSDDRRENTLLRRTSSSTALVATLITQPSGLSIFETRPRGESPSNGLDGYVLSEDGDR